MKVVIIGGVAGGATAAARLRRLDEHAEIIMLERTGFVSYANCGLPYYVGGVITDKEELTLQSPKSFWARFHIDVRVHHEVLEIKPAEKTLRVRRLEDGTEYTESYDKLILSPGANAVHANVPGGDDARIFTLRTVEDTYRIRDYVTANRPKCAVVIGAGFIGLEMAENLVEENMSVTLIQRGGQVMPTLDADMASEIHAYLRNQGIDLRLNTTFTGFESEKNRLRVLLQDGGAVETDLVLLSIGVTPDSTLAQAAGLELGVKDSILVNEHMETSDPNISAVGDAVQVRHLVTSKPALIALAGPANKQGRIAADNICGRKSAFRGSQGSAVLKLFGMTIATTGVNEKMAQAGGLAFDKVVTLSASHASYYPGAGNMTIKTLYDPVSGRILGAQIVGSEGVDKRIDVFATAIRAGMTAAELTELELAYAPPYSSAKDPVNVAGFVIENVRTGLVKQYHWYEIPALRRRGAAFVDLRTPEEYAEGHIPGAVNIPLHELRERLCELDRNKSAYINCYSGLRSYLACRILSENGFDCYNLSGGYRFYAMNASEISREPTPRLPCGAEIDQRKEGRVL